MAQLLAANHYLAGRLDVLAGADHTPVTGAPAFSTDVNALRFSQDGARLAIGLYYDTGQVRVYNTSDWSVVPGTPIVGGNSIWAFGWSPDGSKLAVGYDAAPFYRVFNTADWSEITGLPAIPTLVAAANARVMSADFSPDGARLFLTYQGTGSSKFIDVVDLTAKTLISGTPSVAQSAWSARLSPDGLYFAITSQGCKVFETTGWTQVYTSASTNARGVAWLSDSTALVFGDNGGDALRKIGVASWAQTSVSATTPGDTLQLAYSPATGNIYRAAGNGVSAYSASALDGGAVISANSFSDSLDVVDLPEPAPLLLDGISIAVAELTYAAPKMVDATSAATADLRAINVFVRALPIAAAAAADLAEVRVFVRFVEAIAAAGVEALQQVTYLLRISVGAKASVDLAAVGDDTETLALNLENGGTTRYEGFDFNSYAKISGAYYGCKADGIYQLDGDTDAGAPIRAMVSFGKQDFGTSALKRITNAYIGVSGQGRLFLKVMTEGQEYIYAARSYDEHLQVQRFDTGKGLRTNWLEFELYNADGEDFELASVEFAAVPLSRRI